MLCVRSEACLRQSEGTVLEHGGCKHGVALVVLHHPRWLPRRLGHLEGRPGVEEEELDRRGTESQSVVVDDSVGGGRHGVAVEFLVAGQSSVSSGC